MPQLTTSADIHLRHWPSDSPRAVILLVHGLGEHIGRYEHLARFFNEHHIALLGFDQRGHGRSPGKRGHAPGLYPLLDDVESLLQHAQELHPDTPLFLYGHSMGGNLVLNYAARRRPQISGFIATGAWIRLPENPPALLLLLARFMSVVWSTFSQPNNIDTRKLSRDPEIVQAYNEDPLVHNRISARLATELLDAARWLDQFSSALSAPALIMHGGADQVTDPEGSRAFAERLKNEVKLKLWEGLYHELHNEPEKEEVMRYTLNWVESHLK